MEPNHADPPNHERELLALFERREDAIAEEPFVSAVARHLAAERRTRTLARRLLLAAALVVVVGLSPWLVAGSAALSARLDMLFDYAFAVLATPIGTAVAALGVGAVIYVNRKLIF
jgi:hypothetical protein